MTGNHASAPPRSTPPVHPSAPAQPLSASRGSPRQSAFARRTRELSTRTTKIDRACHFRPQCLDNPRTARCRANGNAVRRAHALYPCIGLQRSVFPGDRTHDSVHTLAVRVPHMRTYVNPRAACESYNGRCALTGTSLPIFDRRCRARRTAIHKITKQPTHTQLLLRGVAHMCGAHSPTSGHLRAERGAIRSENESPRQPWRREH